MSEVIPNRVYVGQLAESTREADLRKFLRGYGDIKEIVVMRGYAFVEFEEESDAEDAIHELDGRTLDGETVTFSYATVRRRGSDHAGKRNDVRRRINDEDDVNADDDHHYHGRGSHHHHHRGRNEDGAEDRYNNPKSEFRRPAARTGDNDVVGRGGGSYGPLFKSPWRLIVRNLSEHVSWQDLKDFMRRAGDVTFTSAHETRRNEGVAEYGSREAMMRALDELDGVELRGMNVKLVRDTASGGGGEEERRRGGGDGERRGEWRTGGESMRVSVPRREFQFRERRDEEWRTGSVEEDPRSAGERDASGRKTNAGPRNAIPPLMSTSYEEEREVEREVEPVTEPRNRTFESRGNDEKRL